MRYAISSKAHFGGLFLAVKTHPAGKTDMSMTKENVSKIRLLRVNPTQLAPASH